MDKRTTALLAILTLCSPAVHAQTTSLNDRVALLSSIGKTDGEYRLGPGDLIEISVFGVDDFRHTLRISATGVMKLPLLEPIKAAGLTAAELEEQLAAVLDGDVIKNPQVSVFVKEYRSQPVFVLGAVQKPGQYQITLELRIIDILAMAGGLENAVDEAVIQRRTENNGTELLKVDLRRLLEQGDLSLNIPVRGGDVVHVQERQPQNVYVLGEVNRAGAIALPVKQDLRVTQAFAFAGGPMKTAKMSGGILVRYNDKGEREQIPVNFEEILKGKKEDFLVKANDIIFVPGSRFKNLATTLLNGVPNTLANMPYLLIP